jgi:site-specific DNA-cytosine methylase
VCFFENVEGHISLGLSSVISDLEELGYKVSWGIFSAAEVGAPHQRKRVFILAHSIHGGRGQEWLLGRMEGIRDKQENNPSTTAKSNSQLANGNDKRLEGVWECCSTEGREAQTGYAGSGCNVWPSRPGEPQRGWEPPRVVANSKRSRGEEPEHLDANLPSKPSGRDSEVVGNSESANGRSIKGDHRGQQGSTCEQEQVQLGGGDCGALRESNGQTQPPLGGNPDGPADWLDYAELYTTCDNRTDELRLLGNGVVPATAERAFRTLIKELL